METLEELAEFRAELVEELARHTYRLTAYSDERLAKVANLKAALDAVDFILANDIAPPAPVDPSLWIG